MGKGSPIQLPILKAFSKPALRSLAQRSLYRTHGDKYSRCYQKGPYTAACSLCVYVCTYACAFQKVYLCVHRSVHTFRTSAPREIDFCLLRSIAFIKRKTKEAVGYMNRREMYPISVDKGKPGSSTLLRLCLLH